MFFLVILAISTALAADPVVTQALALQKAQKFDEAVALLEKAHAGNPKSAEITKALTDVDLAAADAMMADPSLPPARKYPGALRSYRKALELDKNNAKAKQNIALIEGIYTQMGRPIPK